MTDKYHPVTKVHCDHECVCHVYRELLLARGLLAKPLQCANMDDMCIHDTRSCPDPLALLEAWRNHMEFTLPSVVWDAETEFINRLRENPEAVRDELVRMGVWKE